MYLPFDPEAVLRFKAVAVALLGVIAAAIGIWAVGLFGDYFEANPFYVPIMLSNALGIDVLGAIVPMVAALVALMLFLKMAKAPIKKLAITLSVSVALAFLLCHVTPDGLAGYPLLFALGSSIAAAVVNVYPKPFVGLQKNFVSTFTLTLACVPLSLFIADLAYSPSFYGAVIGGNGLTDGLLLSTLYVPLAVTGVFSALSYMSQMILLIEKSHAPNKKSPTQKTGAVTNKIQ
jgi:hypothetical protein